jgi:C_GCAxxG_C_C family probable redox protein
MLRKFRRYNIVQQSDFSAEEKAGQLFDNGYNCAQSVLQATCPKAGVDLNNIAAAFGGGIGNSKCLCGAISGGVMALGLRGKGKRSDEVVIGFKARNRTTCCKALSAPFVWLSKEHSDNCRRLTVETAEHIARIICK